MAYKARFAHGSHYFDLDAGEFDLHDDFAPISADEALNATASPAGSMTGGAVVSKTAQDHWWAWSVLVQGTSKAQTHMAARRLSAWLSGALADKSSKLYFEYTPDYNVPAPVWGQHGAPYRWEVKDAIVAVDQGYYSYEFSGGMMVLPISLYVGPYALGARQRLAQAMGAVFEDTCGTVDGVSRGLVVNGAITNRIVNPSFETNTTSWSVSNGTIERTTDQAWVGSYGLRLTVSTTNTTATAYITGNTGTPLTQKNYVLSARVYIPSQMVGKAVSITIWESGGASAAEATVTKSLTPTAAGWQYIFATGTVKKADRTAVSVYLSISASASTPAGSWVIWDAIQLIGPDVYNIYPYIDGDQLGGAWSSTAHGSTSTSTAGYCRIPVTSSDTFDMKQGTVCAVLKMPYASTDVPDSATNRVFYVNTALRVFYNQADGKFYIHDNTATVGVAASWAAGDIIVVYATWGPAGMKVYFNATASASQTYTNPGAAAYCYIGSNASSPPTERILATFLDFSVWNVPFTDAEVAADYANISPWIRGGDGYGQRLSSVPYSWTKDGDNVVDNCTQGTTYNHYAIVAGIQGSVEADTEISGDFAQDTHKAIHLSNYASANYINPVGTYSKLFFDASGTATGATDCGGSVAVVSVTTSATSLYSETAYLPDMQGRSFSVLARIKDANGVTGYIRLIPYIDGVSVTSRPMATSDTYALYRTPMIADVNYNISNASNSAVPKEITLKVYRNTGTNNLTIDYMAVFPTPYLYFNNSETQTGTNTFFIHGNKIKTVDVTTGFTRVRSINGNPIELEPNKYNLLQSLIGDIGDSPVISDTITYDIYYTPRYLIL